MTKEEKILLIVESPNKCATLKSFLPKNYDVVASVGHISNIKDGGSYWNTGIDPTKEFEANFAVDDSKKEIVAKIKKKIENVDKILIATDEDREGEAIAWSLKKFLKISNAKYERVTFHEITKSAVLEALKHPRKIDDELVNASHARLKLDKMLGYRMTPAVKKFLGIKSVGRCQTAGLLLIAEREQEINNFVPEKYADLFLEFSIDSEDFKAKYWGIDSEVKRMSLVDTKKIVKECYNLQDSGKHFIVENVENKIRSNSAKLPFTTSTYQQEVSSKLGISVETAMKYAQKLFEGINVNGTHRGLITYHRTDSTDIAEEFVPILETFIKSNYGAKYYCKPKKSKQDDLTQNGHECLRVVDLQMTPDELSKYLEDKNLLKVYDIIYRRTIASCMAPALISETIYTIGIDKHKFKMSSKELQFDGYQKVYIFKEKESEEKLYKHTFKQSDILDKYNPDFNIVEKETQPPARYKEATFIKELEARGIGRPSTYATIVSTLLDESRGYCVLQDKTIHPTEKGMKLAELVNEKFNEIISINYTREMEEDLDKIACGKLTESEFLKEFYNQMESVLKEQQAVELCPICKAPMILRKGKYGMFYGCSRYPDCNGIKKVNK